MCPRVFPHFSVPSVQHNIWKPANVSRGFLVHAGVAFTIVRGRGTVFGLVCVPTLSLPFVLYARSSFFS